MVTVLKVSCDNQAITALNFYTGGIKEYGIPSHLRMDNGSEFVHIRSLMDHLNGSDRGSHIWQSVHTKGLIDFGGTCMVAPEGNSKKSENNRVKVKKNK